MRRCQFLCSVHVRKCALTIRSSRARFTAANFSGMFALVCGRAAARLNSGVRHCKRFPLTAKDFLWLVALVGVALFAYSKLTSQHATRAADAAEPPQRKRVVIAPSNDDRSWIKPRDNQSGSATPSVTNQCDGRTHCSQMRSCEEAKYFLQHCPNTEMDGDNDGIPCERQWCS